MSVGEFAALLLWVAAMASHFWQGAYRSMQRYHEGTGPCPDDPTSKCYLDTGGEPEPAESTGQNRYGRPQRVISDVPNTSADVFVLGVSD